MTLTYCPYCANVLMVKVEDSGGSHVRYMCDTCPYTYRVDRKIVRHVKLDRKVVDDVLGGEDAWRHMPKTQASCDRCPSTEAWVQEIQIRAADEPATLFFRCCQCGFQWREG